MAELTVRPAPGVAQKSKKNMFRAYLNPAYLVRYNLREGGIYTLQMQDTPIGHAAIAKSSDRDLKTSVIQLSQCLQTLYSIKLGDKISINPTQVELPFAHTISAVRTSETSQSQTIVDSRGEDHVHWAWLLKRLFHTTEIIAPGIEFEDIDVLGEKRAYRIVEIDSSRDLCLYRMQLNCNVQILDSSPSGGEIVGNKTTALTIPRHDVGGLEDQLMQLDEIVSEYNTSEYDYEWLDGPPPREPGILFHGLPGTGKSLVLRKVADAGWKGVFHVDSNAVGRTRTSQGLDLVKKTFADALRSQPSVIMIDDLESFTGRQSRDEPGAANYSRTLLCQEIDQLHDARVLVVGATRALADIDPGLRHLNRFSVEIEIPVPNSEARAQTLKILSGLSKDADDEKLDNIASRTHGFVGADLERLHRMAGKKAKARVKASASDILAERDSLCSKIRIERMEIDYLNALHHIRPTAMREIFVETPQVRWSDIGGQKTVKEYLEEAIIWPFKSPDDMKRFGIQPTNGLLLYGPPGCSKTMTAKAVATESGLNFIAVKGAELLNMYVGESERAIRELFAKARAVSPSIIFFDEIDAIGAARDGGQHSGVHTVTTLLNELDGVGDLKGVFVLAATNRPEVLDPALTRPGRLDEMIYVGPPDTGARQYILQKRSQNMDLTKDVNFAFMADATEGRSGAEMVDICQRAGKLAYRDQITTCQRQKVSEGHFMRALKEVPKNITPEMEESYKSRGNISQVVRTSVDYNMTLIRLPLFLSLSQRVGKCDSEWRHLLLVLVLDLRYYQIAATGSPAKSRLNCCEYVKDMARGSANSLIDKRQSFSNTPYHHGTEGERALEGTSLATPKQVSQERGHLLVVQYHLAPARAQELQAVHLLFGETGATATKAEVIAGVRQGAGAEAGAGEAIEIAAIHTIVVEKLTRNINEAHLREIFGVYGSIKDLDLPMNRQFNTNRGTAYIIYNTTPSAESAIAHMHEAQLDGAVISVSIVLPRRKFSRSPPPPRRAPPVYDRGPPLGSGYGHIVRPHCRGGFLLREDMAVGVGDEIETWILIVLAHTLDLGVRGREQDLIARGVGVGHRPGGAVGDTGGEIAHPGGAEGEDGVLATPAIVATATGREVRQDGGMGGDEEKGIIEKEKEKVLGRLQI
ncbi:MAG: hypothetical protein Q9217_001536 [Psora testacea]